MYSVSLSVNIRPAGEHSMQADNLAFYRNFTLEGDSFSSIAHRIDALQALVETALAGDGSAPRRRVEIDMPVDVARKLPDLLYSYSKDYDELAAIVRAGAEEAGDGVTISVSIQ